ncbi:hypothetical protein QVD17_30736 [Tagetes erecta]|uniref:Uncharacterized protein n=1 Tax=Tagetes erecta TaxID=13708 RepID=A0AAD8K8G5_TARER|nr:hypothetical protein QVD17_30736 [Tagetes erecta]
MASSSKAPASSSRKRPLPDSLPYPGREWPRIETEETNWDQPFAVLPTSYDWDYYPAYMASLRQEESVPQTPPRVPYPNSDPSSVLPTLDCSNERAIATLAATQCTSRRVQEAQGEEQQQSRQAQQLLTERVATLEARGAEDRQALLNLIAHMEAQLAHAAAAVPEEDPEEEPVEDPGTDSDDDAGSVVSS